VQAVAAAVAKKKKTKKSSGWSWRLAGIALCAFFALGVITGLSHAGRLFALRLESIFPEWSRPGRSAMLSFDRAGAAAPIVPLAPPKPVASVALVERTDGFYTLDAEGELRGPVSPAMQGDLPVLSGVGVQNAPPARLLENAAALVRGEAALSERISEMHADGDGVATFFLDNPRLPLVIALDDAAIEFARSAQVLRLWRSHQDLIALIDMTASGQAVIRLKPGALENARNTAGVHKASPIIATRVRTRRNPPAEVTARR
jgi:hypothetical protein